MNNKGCLVFVFNAHLPFVKSQQGIGKLEERWFFDALVWSYIPFIEMLKDVKNMNYNISVGLSLSPTLLSMCDDESLKKGFEEYLDANILLGEKEKIRVVSESSSNTEQIVALSQRYRDHFLHIKELFIHTYHKNIIAQWKLLAQMSIVELYTTAATHAFFPNIRNLSEVIKAQIENALIYFEKRMQIRPSGFVLPENGYFEGLEEILAEYGITHSFCEPRAILYSNEVADKGIFNPVRCNDVMFFPCDVVTRNVIFSSTKGYCVQPAYRDFHADICDEVSEEYLSTSTHISNVRMKTGYKYNGNAGVGEKELEQSIYSVDLASKQVDSDTEDFISKINDRFSKATLLTSSAPVITQVLGLDLFGHLWYEGIDWLKRILSSEERKRQGIRIEAPRAYLQNANNKEYQKLSLSFSSWSQEGYAQEWLNESNKFINRNNYRIMHLYKHLVHLPYIDDEIFNRIVKQAGRELLLSQSSDWPYILYSNKFTNFAKSKLQTHVHNFLELYTMVNSKRINFTFVYNLEQQNNILPNFDYSMFL